MRDKKKRLKKKIGGSGHTTWKSNKNVRKCGQYTWLRN